MKKIFVTGNVGRDPETRYAPSGESFVTFSFAVTTGAKNNQKTDWLEISCNGKTAEVVQTYVIKGTKLLIEGTPSASAYVNKEGKPVATLRVSASNIEFIGAKLTDDTNQTEPHSETNSSDHDTSQI
jgi:single-strand DNA-binding protein